VAHSFPSVDGSATLLMGRIDAARWFGQQGFRLLMVDPQGGAAGADADEGVARLAERYGMSVTTAQDVADEVATALARLLALMGALVAIGLLVGAFGTANTMLVNLVERQRELSVLWAAGMSRTQLRTMAVVEAGMMGLMGGILGTVVGGMLSWLLVSFARTPGFEPDYVFPWSAALIGTLLAVLAACLAALVPARRIVALATR
jgi:putative ABC transport system permease protein